VVISTGLSVKPIFYFHRDHQHTCFSWYQIFLVLILIELHISVNVGHLQVVTMLEIEEGIVGF
jgi:hypothetical protein